MSDFSFRKSRKIFREGVLRYRTMQKSKSPEIVSFFEETLSKLDTALSAHDRTSASEAAHHIQELLKKYGKKSLLQHTKELIIALILAISVAGLVREMWFEHMEIPTGSMRPTFKEKDHVIVSKNSFGLNKPFETAHFEFDSSLLKRGDTFILTVDKLDVENPDQTYFLLFQRKRRYVKRCLGKNGDTIYFYGGRLYGIDRDGHEIIDYEKNPTIANFEYIPFSSFEGKEIKEGDEGNMTLTFKQMNLPVGRLFISGTHNFNPAVFKDQAWQSGTQFADLWGMNNFAMCRIIEAQDLPDYAKDLGYAADGVRYYLEMRHSPRLPESPYQLQKEQEKHGNYFLPTSLLSSFSWIGLDDEPLKKLSESLYTSRFVVKNGKALRYTYETDEPVGQGVFLSSDIPDGTYEFFHGTAYSIGWQGIASQLDPSHPIYPTDPTMLKTLFNCGIEPTPITNPTYKPNRHKKSMALFPSRYTYFRNGDLYVMGRPLFSHDDPILKQFNDCEKKRIEKNSSYVPFQDKGAPYVDGRLDKEFIRKFGLHIPDHHYLALGDNHANSGDSRSFGFVPENNVQGSPSLIIWPPSDRLGPPPQPDIPFFRIQNGIVCSCAALVTLFSYWWIYRSSGHAAFEKLKKKRLLQKK